MRTRAALIIPFALFCVAGAASAQGAAMQAAAIPPAPIGAAEAAPPAPPPLTGPVLTARTVGELTSPHARQGAAADRDAVYAIDNSTIARISRADGAPLALWTGAEAGQLAHLNSCHVQRRRLLCANSNYPETPMASSVEVFDLPDLTHRESHSLGMMDEGSLTWFSPTREGWIAGFAHYDERGGLEYKDHRFASIVLFDEEWRRLGGWVLPPGVIGRMAPYAASGGALGPDGYLYVTGHDLKEMYVLARPVAGPALAHVATIEVPAEGQAFAWDPAAFERGGRRIAWGIGREGGRIFAMEIPEIPALPDNAEPFAR